MIKEFLRKWRFWLFREQENTNERLQLALGRIESRQVLAAVHADLARTEFSVFSQNGEDGVIQYLTKLIPVANRHFVEFGTQDYRESNTRFLALNDHWSGTIIDGGHSHIDYLFKRSFLGLNRDIKAVQAFITKDNINGILDKAHVPDDLGLLSVDIDGNDFWVLKAISEGRVKPRILVTEYNALFGPDLSLSVPYAADFERFSADASGNYWGASLASIARLAGTWGYALVYCESHGSNAFFVRRDLLGGLKELPVAQAYRPYEAGGSVPPAALRQAFAQKLLEDPFTGERKSAGAWFKGQGD